MYVLLRVIIRLLLYFLAISQEVTQKSVEFILKVGHDLDPGVYIQAVIAKNPEMKFRIPTSEIAAFMKSFGLKISTMGNITKIYSFLKNIFFTS